MISTNQNERREHEEKEKQEDENRGGERTTVKRYQVHDRKIRKFAVDVSWHKTRSAGT